MALKSVIASEIQGNGYVVAVWRFQMAHLDLIP